ncbi:MAG TPA: TonB family protein [Chitinophagaceae bacterium]|nr:TonB family protein [Chitinophagaceae bacterium]
MKPNTILQADLLDIIFENRNKDYGAYTLRKTYHQRLKIALLGMFGVCLVLSLLLFSKKQGDIFTPPATPLVTVTEAFIIRPPQPRPAASSVPVIHTRRITSEEMPPRITDSVNINKPLATPVDMPSSLPVADTALGNDVFSGSGRGNGNLEGKGETENEVKVNKITPRPFAEVMPQYPGGINALLDFLKKNLKAPEDIEEGDVISVKVRFVVNYDGTPEGFHVIQSGGAAFDNEVISVLKKMPLWIPGRSDGENVSVYYTVPVKFTNEY